jgi:phosphomannomutase
MGAKITEIGNKESFVVAFEEAIGALNTTINRDKDSFTASALALEIYAVYQKQGMDFIDVLEKEIYPQYGQWFGKTVAYNYDMLN